MHLRVVMDIGVRHGLQPEKLLHGLGITEGELRGGSPRRHSWDVYAEMLDRMAAHVGGLDVLRRVDVVADVRGEVDEVGRRAERRQAAQRAPTSRCRGGRRGVGPGARDDRKFRRHKH